MSFIGIANNIWRDTGGTGGGGPWILAPGGVVATLDIDFVNNRAWNSPSFVTIPSLLTCTRATPPLASYTNASGGIQYFANDTLRYGTNGLLVEESRINVLTQSNDLSSGTGQWTAIAGGTITTTQNAVGPDGVANSAWTVQLNGICLGIGNTPGGVWAGAGIGSVYLRAKSGTINGSIQGEGDDSADQVAIVLTTTWQRFSSSGVAASTNTKSRYLIVNLPALSQFEAFGGQLEAGAFSTSYIPTTTASVTRAADIVQFSTITWWNSVAGAVYAQQLGGGNASSAKTFAAATVATDDIVRIGEFGGTSTALQVFNVGVQVVAIIGGSWSATTLGKMAGAWTTNDFAFYQDGVQIGTDASGAMPTINRIVLGNSYNDLAFANAYIKRVTYWNSRLSNGALQTLTT